MNILAAIGKKRQGEELTDGAIAELIENLEAVPDYQITALLMAICINGMTERETAVLTEYMAKSGVMLKYEPDIYDMSLDKHSTGGVGDTVSFVALPWLAALGAYIPKMSGRGLGITGGSIDKLLSIPGVSVHLDEADLRRGLSENGLIYTEASHLIAPADKILYELRGASATVDSIPLIASSVMSKKLAAGAKNIVLDVKYGKGAFMKTPNEAEKLGALMQSIGAAYGRNVAAVYDDQDIPTGDYIGNALEIFGAVEVLRGKRNRLYRQSRRIVAAGVKLLGLKLNDAEIDSALNGGAAYLKFRKAIELLGGDTAYIDNPNKLLSARRIIIKADRSGKVTAIDSGILGKTVFDMGSGRKTKSDAVNPHVGVHLTADIGEAVKAGDEIAELYYTEKEHAEYTSAVKAAVKIEA